MRLFWGGVKGLEGEPRGEGLLVERTGGECRRVRGWAMGVENSGWESNVGGSSFAGGGRRGRVSVSVAIIVVGCW